MFDIGLVDWSRSQFALTAMYHWLFVPFTLGVTYIIAVMFTIYYKTGSDFWKKLTQFWTRIFAVNFAIGVATGIILEFEFGTNWSNYSWFVGDIFGAPLVVEGLSAFFLETTFLAVLILGWDKVSKGFHLFSAWMVAIGGSLSATWILIANGWMQHPVGMVFNPDTMRNEMVSIWGVIFNTVGIVKISHTLSQALMLAATVVIGISAWYLLKKREKEFAYKSIKIAAIFGIIFSICTVITGDLSGKEDAKYQPMKVAAIEGLYNGGTNAEFLPVAFFGKEKIDGMRNISWSIHLPGVLSWILYGDTSAYVPGVRELIYGDPAYGIPPVTERIKNGKVAIEALRNYKIYKKEGNEELASIELSKFQANYKDFGYGYFDENNLGELVPPVPFLFWAFRYMVALGFFLVLYFPFIYYMAKTRKLENCKPILFFSLFLIPFVYLGSELGWAVAEVGRQPWIVYEVLPTKVGLSASSATIVKSIFFLFLAIFTLLLIAALKIAISLIKEGPKIDEKGNSSDEKVVTRKSSIKSKVVTTVKTIKKTPVAKVKSESKKVYDKVQSKSSTPKKVVKNSKSVDEVKKTEVKSTKSESKKVPSTMKTSTKRTEVKKTIKKAVPKKVEKEVTKKVVKTESVKTPKSKVESKTKKK